MGYTLDDAAPVSRGSGDDMDVNVGNLLTTLPPIVDADGASRDPHRLLDPPHDLIEGREEAAGVLLGKVLDSGYVGLGDDQGVAEG